MINVLLTTFKGLGLPKTLSIPSPVDTSVAELHATILSRLPEHHSTYVITTTSNRRLSPSSNVLVVSLLGDQDERILPLRLTLPLCGGKGGFGSQLRAAGGRMSSKRKRNQGENNGSNRNLDGRRLRTVTEAKALAEYLAVKPDMDAKEKEARRRRWEQVVEAAEQREADIRSGSKGKVDGRWAEEKVEAEEKTRDAVSAIMQAGGYKDNLFGLYSSEALTQPEDIDRDVETDEDETLEGDSHATSVAVILPSDSKATGAVKTCFGFDEDDQFTSEEEDDEAAHEHETDIHVGNKGKTETKNNFESSTNAMLV